MQRTITKLAVSDAPTINMPIYATSRLGASRVINKPETPNSWAMRMAFRRPHLSANIEKITEPIKAPIQSIPMPKEI